MKRKREIIDDILDPYYDESERTIHIRTKCLKCGYEENVPDYIYEDFGKKKFHKEIKKVVSTLNCQKCDNEKAIPKEYFKK